MSIPLDIHPFLQRSKNTPVIDVRTPAEFEDGHIQGAVNVPLFSNEERAIIGTLYKQQGSTVAIKKGLELVGPKLNWLIEQIQPTAVNHEILLHCWRGGMRSSSVAWLMEMAGLKTYTLQGGYKSFRAAMRNTFEQKWDLRVLGGCTGSGKSKVLYELEKQGQQIIDLEAMARHKGSSFGHLGEKPEVTQETFENELGWKLYHAAANSVIWVEDESKMIGKKNIPRSFYTQMLNAPVLMLDVPVDVRAAYLTQEYGRFSKTDLINATKRIEKRIGPQQCKEAVAHIENGNLLESCKISLVYYDKAYLHGLSKRTSGSVTRIPVKHFDFSVIASELIKQAESVFHGTH